jgi:2-amino-4-hydroxy-6-hydroxymethyldihydropteridine diphosphokinase
MLWQPVYIGLGSNLGDSAAMIERAIAALHRPLDLRLLARSSLYRSRPFGPVEQADFVNAVAAFLTTRSAQTLGEDLRAIESALGRKDRQLRWGPREIDLDLLVFGSQRLSDPRLTVPHPGISERDFVLYPLNEIAPQLAIPGLGRVSRLAACVEDRGTRPLL